MLNDGTLQATAETKKYESALQGVQDAWQGIIEKIKVKSLTQWLMA